MAVDGCYAVMKWILVFINFLFFLVSFLIIGLAVWLLVDDAFSVSWAQEQTDYKVSVFILLTVGLILLLVSILGCCGALGESQCMLVTFFCILLIILVAEIATAVWAFTNTDSLKTMIHNSVKTTIKNDNHDVDRKKAFYVIQERLECCGADGPFDWNNAENIKVSVPAVFTYTIPPSCCVPSKGDAACNAATQNIRIGMEKEFPDVVYQNGCTDELIKKLKLYGHILLGVAIAVMVVELIALIFALVIACAIDRSGRYKA